MVEPQEKAPVSVEAKTGSMPRHFGLGLRLAILIGFIIVLVAGGVAWLQFVIQEENLFREARQGVERFSETLRRSARYAMLRNHREDIQDIITEVSGAEHIVALRVINKAGVVTYSARPTEIGTRLDLEAEACVVCHAKGRPLVAPERDERVRIFQPPGSSQRAMGFITPIYNEPGCSSAACHAHSPNQKVLGVIDAQMSLVEIDDTARRERRNVFWLVAVGSLALALGAGWAGSFFVTRPVKALAAACEEISGRHEDDQLARITPSGIDELEALAHAFNAMAERVEESRKNLEEKVVERTRLLRDAENQIVRSEKLAAMGVLAAGIAHEINNPLTGIITFAHVILRRTPVGSEDESRLKRIIGEAERCSRIVGNLLTFARPSGGEAPINPNTVIHSTIELVSPQDDFHEVKIRTDLDDTISRLGIAAGLLHQVIANLLKNAADAGAHEIIIATRMLRAPGRIDEVEISVEDDGVGIPADLLPKIFDPFYTTKDVGEGTGLGLWVCYRIITEMSGTIEAMAREKGGTRFVMRIPTSAVDDDAECRKE